MPDVHAFTLRKMLPRARAGLVDALASAFGRKKFYSCGCDVCRIRRSENKFGPN